MRQLEKIRKQSTFIHLNSLRVPQILKWKDEDPCAFTMTATATSI